MCRRVEGGGRGWLCCISTQEILKWKRLIRLWKMKVQLPTVYKLEDNWDNLKRAAFPIWDENNNTDKATKQNCTTTERLCDYWTMGKYTHCSSAMVYQEKKLLSSFGKKTDCLTSSHTISCEHWSAYYEKHQIVTVCIPLSVLLWVRKQYRQTSHTFPGIAFTYNFIVHSDVVHITRTTVWYGFLCDFHCF